MVHDQSSNVVPRVCSGWPTLIVKNMDKKKQEEDTYELFLLRCDTKAKYKAHFNYNNKIVSL